MNKITTQAVNMRRRFNSLSPDGQNKVKAMLVKQIAIHENADEQITKFLIELALCVTEAE